MNEARDRSACVPRVPDPEVQTWRDGGGKEIAGIPQSQPMGGSTALHRNIKTTVTGQTEKPDVSEILFWSWFPTLGFSVR